MKNKFYGFLVYLKSLKGDDVRLNFTMDGRNIDHFDDKFYVGNKQYTIPSNFYSFFEKIIEKSKTARQMSFLNLRSDVF